MVFSYLKVLLLDQIQMSLVFWTYLNFLSFIQNLEQILVAFFFMVV